MSSNQPTLFGAYPWADGTTSSPTLYGSGYIPQTFSVSLSDAVTGTEADLVNMRIPLSESMTLTEAQVKLVTKILADSETVSDATVHKTIQKVLSESSSVTDAGVVFVTVKDLQDFLVLKEWISIRLIKQITWVNPSTNANIFDTLYGKYKFGTSLFGGLKPLASWSRNGVRGPSVWTNANGHKYNS